LPVHVPNNAEVLDAICAIPAKDMSINTAVRTCFFMFSKMFYVDVVVRCKLRKM
jgi:hypothetical protein